MRQPRVRGRATWIGAVLLLGSASIWLATLGPSCGPWGRTPGFLLLGESVAEPVSDWSFVRSHPEIALETATPWLVPHSVTVSWLLVAGQLFIPSRDAATKTWVRNVLRRPDARLRIGKRIYRVRLVRAADPALRERLVEAALARWPEFRSDGDDMNAMDFFRVEPR